MTTYKTEIDLSDKVIADFRKLDAMEWDAEGLDGIKVVDCFQNGRDTAAEEGFEPGTIEFDNAALYFAVSTARLYEVI